MNSFFDKIIWDNSIKAYSIVVGIILLLWIVKKLVSKYCAGIIYRLVLRARKTVNKEHFFTLLVKPIEIFLLLFFSYIAIDKLHFPKALNFEVFNYPSKTILTCIANASLVISFIWMCLRVIDFMAVILEEKANKTKDTTDDQLIVFFKDFFKVILVIVGVLMVLHFAFNRDVSNLLTGLSIVGAAIALATRESLENLIASFIIFFDKPFTQGDVVKVQNIIGTVEKIGLRSTRLRTEQKTFVTVPNKQMVDSIVDNISLRTLRKAELKLELSLQTSTTQLQHLKQEIENYLTKQEGLQNPVVLLIETGKQAHILQIDFFTSIQESIDSFNELKQQVNFELIHLTNQSQIIWAGLEERK
jgi:MscS family membrane protein